MIAPSLKIGYNGYFYQPEREELIEERASYELWDSEFEKLFEEERKKNSTEEEW